MTEKEPGQNSGDRRAVSVSSIMNLDYCKRNIVMSCFNKIAILQTWLTSSLLKLSLFCLFSLNNGREVFSADVRSAKKILSTPINQWS